MQEHRCQAGRASTFAVRDQCCFCKHSADVDDSVKVAL